MSEPGNAPPSRTLQHTGGEIVMILLGALFLLPGACSLYFVVALTIEKRGNPLSDPYVQAFAAIWVICFFISAAGAALIWLARRNARARAS
jgi:tryptophan-rich sensory protein